MKCPICSSATSFLWSRPAHNERRRECLACKHRFTTVEMLKEEHQAQQEAVQVVREAAEKLKAVA